MNYDALIYEKIQIFNWFIDGLGLHGISWHFFGGLTKEWISKNYNVELSYFNLDN